MENYMAVADVLTDLQKKIIAEFRGQIYISDQVCVVDRALAAKLEIQPALPSSLVVSIVDSIDASEIEPADKEAVKMAMLNAMPSYETQRKYKLFDGALPPPEAQSVRRLMILWHTNNASTDRFRENYHGSFILGRRDFYPFELARFPLRGDLDTFTEVKLTETADGPRQYVKIVPELKEPWCHQFEHNLIISSQLYYCVEFEGEPFVPKEPIRFTVLLDGIGALGVQ